MRVMSVRGKYRRFSKECGGGIVNHRSLFTRYDTRAGCIHTPSVVQSVLTHVQSADSML